MRKENDYCVILAGGQGRRLWPYSRKKKPKQFIDFFGNGQSLLQQTYKRFAQFIPEDHIYVSTFAEYADITYEQLPNLPKDNVLLEPVQLSTAPAVGMAHCKIALRDPNANIIISPCDQFIMDEERFTSQLIQGLAFVERNPDFLALGVNPTYPNTGYGYIQMGEATSYADIYKVKAFTEKPDREFAQLFMESGEWLWNTGLFLANARYLRTTMEQYMPSVLRHLDEIYPHWTIDEENAYMQEHFRSYPNLSIDYGILEKSEHVCVARCQFGWADVGTWHGIYEAREKDAEGNVVIDSKVLFDDSRDNVVKLSKGKLAVLGGLEGYIVAEKGNVLLVCKKEDSSALVRKYVNEIAIRTGEEYL